MLGSRSALRTVHRGVRGVHQMHRPPVLAGHLDQRRLGRTDRGIGGLTGHVDLARNFGLKSSTAKASWSTDHALGPLAGGVLTLPGHLLVQLRGLPLRFAVALRRGLPLLRLPAGHHPLVAARGAGRRSSRAAAWGRSWSSDVVVAVSLTPQSMPITRPVAGRPRARWRQRRRRTRRRYRRGTHAPRTAARAGPATTPPVTTMPPARCRRPSFRRKPAPGVFEGGKRVTLLLVLRHPGPLPHRQPGPDVLERLRPGLAEISNQLLLRDTQAALPQPRRCGHGPRSASRRAAPDRTYASPPPQDGPCSKHRPA